MFPWRNFLMSRGRLNAEQAPKHHQQGAPTETIDDKANDVADDAFAPKAEERAKHLPRDVPKRIGLQRALAPCENVREIVVVVAALAAPIIAGQGKWRCARVPLFSSLAFGETWKLLEEVVEGWPALLLQGGH